MVGTEDITVRTEITEGEEIATIEQKEHVVKAGTKDTEVIIKVTIPEEDAQLVADQTGKSIEDAKRALEESDGDLAKAILLLQTGG